MSDQYDLSEWEPIDLSEWEPIEETRRRPSLLRRLGAGVVEGLAELSELARYLPPVSPGVFLPAADAAAVDRDVRLLRGVSDRLREGVPAESFAEHAVEQVGRTGPTVAIPIGSLPMRAASVLASALAGAGARTVSPSPTVHTVAELAGGVAPDVARGVAGLARQLSQRYLLPLSARGRERLAARTMREFAEGSPEELVRVLEAGPERQTVAMVTGDPGLAQLEVAVAKTPQGQVLHQAAHDREAAREALVRSLVREEIPPEELGQLVRERLAGRARDAAQRVGGLYREVDAVRVGPVSVGQLRQAVRSEVEQLFPERVPRVMDGRLSALVSSILDESRAVGGDVVDTVQLATLTGWRRQAHQAAAAAQRSGHRVDERLARRVVSAIDDTIRDAATRGEGLTPDQAEALGRAIAARRRLGEVFERGAVGSVLRKRGWGEYVVRDSGVLRRLLADKAAIEQVMRAGDQEAVDLLRDAALTNMLHRPQARWGAWLDDWGERLTSSGLFDPEHVRAIRGIVDELTAEAAVSRAARAPSRGQSTTVQGLSTLRQILRDIPRVSTAEDLGAAVVGGVAASGPGGVPTLLGAGVGGGAVHLLGRLYESAADEYLRLLARALVDKDLAIELLQQPTPERVAWSVSRLAEGVTGAVARTTALNLGEER